MLAREDGTACTRGPRISKNPDRRGQRWKGRKERDWEKLAHITVCIFADTCTFAPRILEEDDYLHRDTSSLSRLVYLLIYFLVLRVYRFFFLSRLSMFLSSFFPSLPSLFFSLFLHCFSSSCLDRRKFLRFTGASINSSVKISEFHRNGKTETEKPMADARWTIYRFLVGPIQAVSARFIRRARWNFTRKHDACSMTFGRKKCTYFWRCFIE